MFFTVHVLWSLRLLKLKNKNLPKSYESEVKTLANRGLGKSGF